MTAQPLYILPTRYIFKEYEKILHFFLLASTKNNYFCSLKKNSMENLAKYFFNGMFFCFGVEKNPLNAYKNSLSQKSDAENLANDWKNVGLDIQHAFENETAPK
jgi:hypothetical protein